MGKDLKHYAIFLLPALILLLGSFLYFKFLRVTPTDTVGRIPETEGIEIEDRTSGLLDRLGVSKDNSRDLQVVDNSLKDIAFGAVSWSKSGDASVSLTITANLPETKNYYFAWFKQEDVLVFLGELTKEKAGYILDTTIQPKPSQESVIVVSEENKKGYQITHPILEARINF